MFLLAALPGLTALVALFFTWMSVEQTQTELRIAEQGQITSRFNAAVGNLGSDPVDVRLGGIYALQRIMQDSSRDQPTVVSVLSAYARQKAPVPPGGFVKEGSEVESVMVGGTPPSVDVNAAITVLFDRPPGRDGLSQVDLHGTDLRGLQLYGRDSLRTMLPGGQAPEGALRSGLRSALLYASDLRHSYFGAVDLRGVVLLGANLSHASFEHTDLTGAVLSSADLTNAYLYGSDLSDARLESAKLQKAMLVEADLSGADLTGADLKDADLRRADLTDTNLTDADLQGAKLTGAILKGARGLPPSLRR